MATPHGNWLWYELVTHDPEGAKSFYEAVVGWSMTTSHGDSDEYGFITNPDGGVTGGVLRLNTEMTDHGARPCWLGYVGVDDCDAAIVATEAKGGRCLMPARDIEMAGRIALLADCCGAPFYVMAPALQERDAESTAFSETLPGRCAWNELAAGDAAGATSFYTSLFGWSLPDPMDMGEMGKYQFIAHDGITIGAIYPKPPEMPAPCWTHYFRVENIDAANDRIGENGGKVLLGPMEVPGGEWIIQAMDPQGTAFALVGTKKG